MRVFIYARTFCRMRRERECENVRGSRCSRGKSPSLPVSRFFIPSFLPWCDMRPRGVYFLSGYYMHILLSCIRFSTLERGISLTFPGLPPPLSFTPTLISRAYTVLHGACKFNSPVHPRSLQCPPPPLRSPSPSPSPSFPSLPV